ncbi:glutamine synthetase family protein [Elongatibacter sediminis]|uniref:Glutamine synthetase family protein n=1 Tax=Elongatibacter sediminis TaxID=3119006 RepID=A0AAW9R6T0_9GAMM
MPPAETDATMSPVLRYLDEHPETDSIEVVLSDLNGVLRGKWLPASAISKVLGGQFKISLTAVSPDIWGRDVPVLCEKIGDGDGICTALEHTIRPLPWLERPTAQILLQLNTEDGAPWGYDPRVILGRVCERYRELGLTPVCAPELEFYLLPEEREANGTPRLPATRANGHCQIGGQLYSTEVMQEHSELLHAFRAACEAMQVPLDGLVKELAPSQYELNLHHVDDPLAAADHAQWLKQAIKGVARKHGLIATFMAKPFGNLDGNGFHHHVSVLDKNGRNVFDDGTEAGSDLLRSAIAGLADTMADCMLIFAPHHNSYRRLWRGVHGPLQPTWGYENRYVSIRVPNGEGAARRIEHRIAGADANPYLALAAILAGMLHGIDNRLEPEAPVNSGKVDGDPILPANWYDALRVFEQSDFIAGALGADFQEAFREIKRAEQQEFTGAVNPLEYDTYLVMA